MVVLGLLGYAFGIDPRLLIGGAEMVSKMSGGGQQQQVATPGEVGAPKDQVGRFVASILAENEDVWNDILPAQTGVKFKPAPIVLFNGVTSFGLRHGAIGDGAVLLPARRQDLSRHVVLRAT